MRYIFYCEKCGYVGSDEEFKKDNPVKCPDCGMKLVYSNIPQDIWRSKTNEEKNQLKSEWAKKAYRYGSLSKESLDIRNKCIDHMLTSGYNFEGYSITSYNGIVSGEVVLGTGFLSELSASINDFFGSNSEEFAKKMAKAKEFATNKMIEQSAIKNGNAIIGIDFDYTTYGNNMVAVSANGTSVTIKKLDTQL